ncbi:hypothetical protein Trydic_g634 [Trypoxylus dichotomus]
MENKVEVREDEEQSVKLQEIIDLLVAAGYFRARIKGLSPFDKVVGGMTWCIESCTVDIDINLLFQENSTIGQKISLTEKLVAVLIKMKCPYRIEPHQIQGLDFIHIFPIIQWLVKKSVAFRQEISSFVRLYAVNQFNKTFSIMNKKLEAEKQILGNVETVLETYKPRRYYKRKTTPPDAIFSRVQITLLEYGLYGISNNVPNKSSSTDTISDQNQELHVQQLLHNMAISEHPFESDDITDEDRKELFKHYSELQLQMKDSNTFKEEEQILKLEQQKLILDEQSNKIEKEKAAVIENISATQALVDSLKTRQAQVRESLEQIEEEINNRNENVTEIEKLVKENDEIRLKETQLKEQYRQQLANLQEKIQDAKQSEKPPKTDVKTNKELEEEIEAVKSLRLYLAKKNRIISALQRQLDEMPSRPELAQYQRRFLELYNQVAAKHKETKQYYSLYNTLEDTKVYITKELSLLNSISDSYPEAMQSSASSEEFLNQLINIVEGVKQSKAKIENKRLEEKQKHDQLISTLQGLIDTQRRYVVAVRQLSVECKKYEMILAQVNK